jgi:phosphoribosylanthranilate isomerase
MPINAKKSPKIKLCGFKDKEQIDFVCGFNIDFIGFVFYKKSPRNVDLQNISHITKDIPANIKKVAVIVNETDDKIAQIINLLKPDLLQLHGEENLERVKEIKNKFQLPIIKAIGISEIQDLENISKFEKYCQYFLFDYKDNTNNGGSGQSFDWSILDKLNINIDWFLSGGINKNNLAQALTQTNAKMIDLSSALEENRGQKSKKAIKDFMRLFA